MENKPLITCFMLTYNKFEYIFEAIDSILAQTYPRIELAIFDDHSVDFPQEQIREYIDKNKKQNIERIIIHHSPENQGTVKNFNNVIKNTHGKYLLGAGIDDVIHNESVFEQVVSFFEETGAEVITCIKEVIDNDGKKTGRTPSEKNAKRIAGASTEKLYKMVAMGVAIAGAGTYYARSIFDKFDGFDESYRLQEDGPFFLRMLRNGYKIWFADIVAVNYRLGNGISSAEELHPELKKDINRMLEKEILPYMDRFGFWEKRRIYYQVERFKKSKQLTGKEKIYFCLKYPDVIIYRKIMAV